VWFKLLIIFQL